MPTLKKNPTLKDIQKYVSKMEKERGFEDDSIAQKCVLLGEELGELFKMIRKDVKIKMDVDKVGKNLENNSVGYEIVDMMIVLCAIANRYEIDLEKSFREKEEINKRRKWK